MAKVTHVSQFAHDIAVRVLEHFDKYGVCEVQLARDASGRPVRPMDLTVACMCITGRIVNAFPDDGGGYYEALSVKEIARTITGGRTECPAVLYARNDRLFYQVGPDALRERTRRLFKRIAALPVVDENPTEFRVGGVYENKMGSNRYTVVKILPAGEHSRGWYASSVVAEFSCGGFDVVEAIHHYRRVA